MEMYILSKGRADRQTTFNNLPPSIQQQILIAVYPEELAEYRKYPVFAVDCKERGVGHKRQHLVEQCKSKHILMLDDDLVFATRRTDDRTKFNPASAVDIEDLISQIDERLEQYAHVGVAGREGGNRNTLNTIRVGRMTRVLGYQVDTLGALGIRFDEVQLMEDFNVTLRLLRLGLPNLILNHMVQNQNGSNAAGGVSSYRTLERQAQAAHDLAALHTPFVTAVTKKTKTAWNGLERTDVRIQWKAAYDSSQ